jgi:Glycosyl transferase family 2
VRSVQRQSVDDIEILICGDGVGDDVRAVVAELQAADPRIRFFDLPKAPHIGQRNRDHVLRQAEGTIICVHNDDDLWLPGHIEAQERALADADFVGAMQVNVGTDGKVRAHYFDLERPEFVEPWLAWKPNNFGSWASNGFGPIFVAFRLEAYLRLPDGWTAPPPGLPNDQAMWHKFVREPWCRTKFLRWPIALHFSSADRDGWTPQQRADELLQWTEIIQQPDYAARIWRDLLPELGDRLLAQTQQTPLREVTAAHEAELTRMRSEQAALKARIAALEAELAAVRVGAAAHIGDLNAAAAATREAVAERVRQLEDQIQAVTRGASTEVAKAAAKVAEAQAALIEERAVRVQAEIERDVALSRTTERLRRTVQRPRGQEPQ